jgi:anaerobic selenocysteine-containing dehydrogenase
LHRKDAEALGIGEGERISVRTEKDSVELAAKLFDRMAAGVVIIPRLRRLPWQALGKRIRRQDIRKA